MCVSPSCALSIHTNSLSVSLSETHTHLIPLFWLPVKPHVDKATHLHPCTWEKCVTCLAHTLQLKTDHRTNAANKKIKLSVYHKIHDQYFNDFLLLCCLQAVHAQHVFICGNISDCWLKCNADLHSGFNIRKSKMDYLCSLLYILKRLMLEQAHQ